MNKTERDADDIITVIRARLGALYRVCGTLQLSKESLYAIETADAAVRSVRWELRDVSREPEPVSDGPPWIA